MNSGTHSRINEVMQVLEKPSPDNTQMQEFYRELTTRKNRDNIDSFCLVEFSERIVLLPQCLRNLEKCIAHEVGSRYECAGCGGCKISDIIRKARELGYRAVCVLKGGRAVRQVLAELQPGAVLGVACHFEGSQGILDCEAHHIPVQFVPLVRDGCANTDVILEKVLELMEFRKSYKKEWSLVDSSERSADGNVGSQ